MRILVVDDEPNIRRTLRTTMEAMGHSVAESTTPDEALHSVDRQGFELVLLDLRLGDRSGLDLLEPLLARDPRTAIVIITAHATIDNAVDAMKRGAFDYLPKPFTPSQVRSVIDRVSTVRGLRETIANLEETVRSEVPEIDLNANDPAMTRVLDLARKVAPTDAGLLIRGENGTGKGVLSRAIHGWSKRSNAPFVTVSCPSLSAELLESELFGHVRGAFTGAVRDARGKVAAAEGGTLFLDEIGDLPTSLQPKLLRFLQDRQYERIGDPLTRTANVRLIAATNRDLETAVAQGGFREDLLYRLNVVELTMPPLRSRTDLDGIANHLLRFFADRTNKRVDHFTGEARDAIRRHQWPGNLRELRNAVERAVIVAEGNEIGLTDLPEKIAGAFPLPSDRGTGGLAVGGDLSLDELEREHIRRVLNRTSGLDQAARTLGIDPSTLYRKRKQFGL